MPIKFTKHALERIKNRNLSKSDVIECLNHPDKEKKGSFGNIIAQKIQGTHLLRVFYFYDKNSKVVVTAYKTSKVKKYL